MPNGIPAMSCINQKDKRILITNTSNEVFYLDLNTYSLDKNGVVNCGITSLKRSISDSCFVTTTSCGEVQYWNLHTGLLQKEKKLSVNGIIDFVSLTDGVDFFICADSSVIVYAHDTIIFSRKFDVQFIRGCLSGVDNEVVVLDEHLRLFKYKYAADTINAISVNSTIVSNYFMPNAEDFIIQTRGIHDPQMYVYNGKDDILIYPELVYTLFKIKILKETDKYLIHAWFGDKPTNEGNIYQYSNGQINRMGGKSVGSYSTSFSNDGETLFVGLTNGYSTSINMNDLTVNKTFKTNGGTIWSTELDKNGRYLLTPSDDSTLVITDFTNRDIVYRIKTPNEIVHAKFDENNQTIFTAPDFGIPYAYYLLDTVLRVPIDTVCRKYTSVDVSVDNKYVLMSSFDSSVYIYQNEKSFPLKIKLVGHEGEVWSAKFSPSGKLVASCGKDGKIILWDILTGREIKQQNATSDVMWVEFSNDSILVYGTREGQIYVWDTGKNNKVISTTDKYGAIWSISLNAFRNIIAITSSKNVLSLYRFPDLQYLCSMMFTSDNQMVLWNEKLQFDGSKLARDEMSLTCGNTLIGLQQLKAKLWIPNLGRAIMNGEDIQNIAISDLDICSKLVQFQVSQVNSDNYVIKFKKNNNIDLKLSIYLNGVYVDTIIEDDFTHFGDTIAFVVNLGPLRNFLVSNQHNDLCIKSVDQSSNLITGVVHLNIPYFSVKPSTPKAYGVFIGVSEYKSHDLDLKFAAQDAKDLSVIFKSSASKLLGDTNVIIYKNIADKGQGYLAFKEKINKTLSEISSLSKSNDIVLIYMAGHGVQDIDNKLFYFLTAETSTDDLKSKTFHQTSISVDEISEWLKPQYINAQKRILIMDACNSGKVISELFSLRDDNSIQMAVELDNLNDKYGVHILAASQASEGAYEFADLGHGVLTYSLLNSINDVYQERNSTYNFLDVNKWFMATKDGVLELNEKYGIKQSPQVLQTNSFTVGLIDKDLLTLLPKKKHIYNLSPSAIINSNNFEVSDNLNFSLKLDSVINSIVSLSTIIGLSSQVVKNSVYIPFGFYKVRNGLISLKIGLKQNNSYLLKYQDSDKVANLNLLIDRVAKRIIYFFEKETSGNPD
jgi:WD40 repeat protein